MGRPTLTERRKAQTRREIAETALALFARQGYDGVSAETIAEEAGVSLRTFYRYFTGKDAVPSPIVTRRHASRSPGLPARWRQAVEPHAGRGRRRLLCLGNQQTAAPLIACPLRTRSRRVGRRSLDFCFSIEAAVRRCRSRSKLTSAT